LLSECVEVNRFVKFCENLSGSDAVGTTGGCSLLVNLREQVPDDGAIHIGAFRSKQGCLKLVPQHRNVGDNFVNCTIGDVLLRSLLFLFWDQSLFGTNLAALNVASINVVDDFGDVGFPFEVDECKSSCQTSPTIHID